MTFVKEQIPDADREMADAMTDRLERGKSSIRWVADRERDAYLFYGRTEREGPPETHEYLLVVKGHPVRFTAAVKGSGNNNEGVRLQGRVYGLWVHPALAGQVAEITQLIRDALTEDAFGSDRRYVTDFRLEINPPFNLK